MKRITHKRLSAAIALALFGTLYSITFAAPPQEAINACSGLSEDTSCSILTPNGNTVSGMCQTLEGQLACVPSSQPQSDTTQPQLVEADTQLLTDESVENSKAYYDSSTSTLFLPETDAGVLGSYSLTFKLTEFEPLTFDLNLSSITQVTPTTQPNAVYNLSSGTLTIPNVQVGTDWYNDVQMVQPILDVYRFELTTMTAGQAPSDSDGTSENTGENGTSEDVNGDGGTTGTSGVHPISDTNQSVLYDDSGNLVDSIQTGDAFFGQDANYIGTPFNYTDNNDGTVTDHNTGLLWEQAHHATRLSFYDAKAACEELDLGGHTSWRLPNLKELFSLANFKGNQHSGRYYLDNDYFDLAPPEAVDDDQFSSHTVQMMGQTWSSIIYTGDHWNDPNIEAAFFFNFLDGHIKQAPTHNNEIFYRCVYGDEYGVNDFVINSDGTVTDQNSGLIWQHQDDGVGRNWQDSLAYCEGLELAGQTDWRLPNIKELQSIVDYTRHDPAIDPAAFSLTDSEGWFWSGTTHGDSTLSAAYICFGKCDSKDDVDTHGAGAQRADPKSGEPADYSEFGGAQDDDVRINNYSRCVRGGVAEVSFVTTDPDSAGNISSGDVAGPPQEAIDACSGLTENASCSIQAGDQTISGSCSDLQGTLACKPK